MKNLFLLLSALLVTVFGCSDATVDPNAGRGTYTDAGVGNRGNARRLTIICAEDAMGANCQSNNAEVFALTGQSLQVRVAYDENQRPLPMESVTFKLLSTSGVSAPNNTIDGSSLVSQGVQTDSSGVATGTIAIGTVESTFVVEASAPQASPVRWRVVVGNAGVGAFSVRVTYPDQGRYRYSDFSRADVFLFDRRMGNQSCANIARTATDIRNATSTFTIGEQGRPFSAVDNVGEVSGLLADSQFTIAALIMSRVGAPVAFGCLDSQRVVGGQVTPINIVTEDLPNTFKGLYNALHRFDLRQALATSDSSELQSLNEFLTILHLIGGDAARRADALRSLLCDYDDALCNAVAGIGGALLDGYLQDILNDIDPRLYDTLSGLSELVGMLEDFRVLGKIEFSESVPDPSDGWIRGSETRWETLRLTWRGQQRDITIGDLTTASEDPDGRVRVISAFFDGYLSGANLEIDEHYLDINMGIILLGIAEFWVLPAIVGLPAPVDLSEILLEYMPCETINGYLSSNANSGFCEDEIVPLLANLIRTEIGKFRLTADGIKFTGTVVPVDMDGDLTIDTLDNGVWEGELSETNQFLGCFNACKCLDAICSCQPDDCTVPITRQP